MEIIAGVGVEAVKVGEARNHVERRLGHPVHAGVGSGHLDRRAVYDATQVTLVVTYDRNDIVELVEVPYGRDDQVFFDGIQLTYRFIDDVVADLTAAGHAITPFDIGFSVPAGFAIFSMASLSARDLDPAASEDDDRRIVEGVSIAPYSYFAADQPPVNGTVEELEAWLRHHGVPPMER